MMWTGLEVCILCPLWQLFACDEDWLPYREWLFVCWLSLKLVLNSHCNTSPWKWNVFMKGVCSIRRNGRTNWKKSLPWYLSHLDPSRMVNAQVFIYLFIHLFIYFFIYLERWVSVMRWACLKVDNRHDGETFLVHRSHVLEDLDQTIKCSKSMEMPTLVP